MTRDLRMSGYRGCLSSQDPARKAITSSLSAPTSYPYAFNTGLVGYHAVGSGWSPSLDATISALSPAPTTGSDVLTLRAATGTGAPLATAMTSSTAAVSVNAPTTTDLVAGAVALIADCVQATTFQITSVTPGTTPTLLHAASGLNASADFGRAFSVDAMVIPMQTITYYVGPSSVAPTGTENSLWRVSGTGAPQELIEDVVSLRVLYGEDTDGDMYANKFSTAENVGSMDNVVAVRLDLLFRSHQDQLAARSGASVRFQGTSTPATDRRLYRTITSTVMLRNRSI